MNRSLPLRVLASGFSALFGVCAAHAADVVWDVEGPAPFATSSNWADGVAPDLLDDAIIANGGTATISATDTDIEIFNLQLQNGAVTQSGGLLSTFGAFNIGATSGQTATYTATGGGIARGALRVGENGGTGTLSLTNASYSNSDPQTAFFGNGAGSHGALVLGDGSTFTLNVSGGDGNGLVFGRSGGQATLTMSGNARLVTEGSGGARHIYLGQALGTTGGQVEANLSNSAQIESSGRLYVADGDGTGGQVTATMNLSGTAQAISNDYFVIGRNGGTGFVTVSEEAKLIQRATQHLIVGDHGASKGTLTVKDHGTVESFGDLRVGGSGDGTMNIEGDATVTSGRGFIVGFGSGSNGQLFIKDNAKVEVTDNFAVGLNEGATGSVEMTGGTVNVLSPGHRFLMAAGKNSQGTMTMSGGTITVQNEVWIGNAENGVAELNMSGDADLKAVAGLYITFGRGDFSKGTLNISGNAKVTHEGGSIRLGEFPNAQGFINASGNSVITSANNIEIAEGGIGAVHVSENAALFAGGVVGVGNGGGGRGTLTMDGGTLTATGGLAIANGPASSGTVNLNGGTIIASEIRRGVGDNVKLNLNGGTLRATGDNADYLSFTFMPGEIEVQAGGARIDTNGFLVVVNSELAGSGGLTKLGGGTLVLGGVSTFTGFSSVQAGTLEVEIGGSLAGTVHLDIAANAELLVRETVSLNEDIVLTLVDHSQLTLAFDGEMEIAALWINGEAVAPDQYTLDELNGLAGGAVFEGNAGAILNVTSTVPEPGTLALLAGAGIGLLLFSRRRS